jgi:hypothetical protein
MFWISFFVFKTLMNALFSGTLYCFNIMSAVINLYEFTAESPLHEPSTYCNTVLVIVVVTTRDFIHVVGKGIHSCTLILFVWEGFGRSGGIRFAPISFLSEVSKRICPNVLTF